MEKVTPESVWVGGGVAASFFSPLILLYKQTEPSEAIKIMSPRPPTSYCDYHLLKCCTTATAFTLKASGWQAKQGSLQVTPASVNVVGDRGAHMKDAGAIPRGTSSEKCFCFYTRLNHTGLEQVKYRWHSLNQWWRIISDSDSDSDYFLLWLVWFICFTGLHLRKKIFCKYLSDIEW